jgi:hypothetical protein
MTARKHASSTTAPPIQAAACAGIHEGIVALVHGARHAAARSVNAVMTSTCWEFGGKERALSTLQHA